MKIPICVLSKQQNKAWHGRDPITNAPRSKDALKFSCYGPDVKGSRLCQMFHFGMCRRKGCSFEHKGGKNSIEVNEDAAWSSFRGESDRYTHLQHLVCNPGAKIPRRRVCVCIC